MAFMRHHEKYIDEYGKKEQRGDQWVVNEDTRSSDKEEHYQAEK